MVSKNRRLVSGLLSALLVSGSASAGFVGSAAGAAKSALELPLNVAGKVVGSVVGAAALAGVGYILYLSYRGYKAILDGSIGLYCFSEKGLSDIFVDALREYNPAKGSVYECLKNSAKVVGAAASGLATKLSQLSGNKIVKGNVSLKKVVNEYCGDKIHLNDVTASKIVISAVEGRVKSDVAKGKITANHGELSKLFWRGVVRIFPESCWRQLVWGSENNVTDDIEDRAPYQLF